MAELTRLLGISRSTIYENESGIKILRCHLPRPVRLGVRL
ncbi:helix-turn-helix transcriptional regulator [Shigella sonnei]|nr:AlpA family phage regulatory protein [Shigella sonnei]